MHDTRADAITYWKRVIRFALRGELPTRPVEVPTWALSLPYRLWDKVIRYDGRTFEDLQAGRLSAAMRRVLPLRALYLLFLFAWPLVAFVRSLKRGRGALRYWRLCLGYPELSVLHPDADYNDREAKWSRPDFSLGMYYAWRWHRSAPNSLRIDDKRHFLVECEKHGIPTPPTYTAAQAVARGGTFIVKDPQRDLGAGVAALTADEIRALGDEADELIIQMKLHNHAELLKVLPDDAPLSSFRVITTLDPKTREPHVSRCAIRIGRAGVDADNTARGGIWAQVDRRTGKILAGVTKASFGRSERGVPVRFETHPDTGKSFVGMRVPWFDEGRLLALVAHRRLGLDLISLGWDVAISASGPILLEVNVWTTCYDYDPPDDAFTPACKLIVKELAGSNKTTGAVRSAAP
jgi:hypothetical protein